MAGPPFTIVFDHPRQHLLQRAWRRTSGLIGALLLVIGLTASIPAVPATLAATGLFLGWVTTEPTDPEPFPPEDVPVREVILVFLVSLPAAIVCGRLGLWLLRRHRTLILFLRRFGHDEAQQAVTFAVLRTIGSSWRVVTLDDAEIAPIGVTVSTRRLFSAGHVTSRHVIAAFHFLGLRMFPILILSMWGVLALGLLDPALEFARTGVTNWQEWANTIDPYVRIVGSVFERQPPLEFVGPTLPGVFAILAMAAAMSFLIMIASSAALLLAVPLGAVLFFLSSSADAVRAAEKTKTVTANTIFQINAEAHRIAERSRKVFGPRLVVLRVASHIWQHAVTTLATVSALPLIDVSEPTENVLWELELLMARFGDRCIVIGQHDRLMAIADAASSAGCPPVMSRLAALLAGREVLAYTADARGLRRFARALRGLFLTKRP